MKILIVDDELNARESLENKIKKFSEYDVHISHADGVISGLEKLQNGNFDLVFLDIKMPDGTGFDLLSKLDEKPLAVAFTTAFDEFALKAFEFAAIGYLLKPIEQDKLKQVLDTAQQMKSNSAVKYKLLIESYHEKKLRKIVVPNTEGFIILELGEIIYLKSDINYTEFHTTDKKLIISSKTLKEFSSILEGEGFFRIHQSYLINLTFAREFKKANSEVILQNGDSLPVARQKKQLFTDLFR